jgi:hypothetical protein
MGFKPTIPVFERVKMVDAVDRALTVMGIPEDGLQVLSILRLQQTSVPELIK